MNLCIKCGILSVVAIEFSSKRLRQYCRVCILDAIKKLPNPDCEHCLGEGEYYWHNSYCLNDDCVLAGGYDDCNGQIIDCNCSILDGVTI